MSVETQKRMIQETGITVVYEYGEAGPKYDIRSAYVRALQPGDEAWVPRLDVLAMPRKDRGKVRATTDLAGVIADILGRGAIIVDGSTGVTSRDGNAWRKRVEWAMRKVAAGHASPAKARKAGRKGGAKRKAESLETLWNSPSMATEKERWAAVWRDSKYENAQAAADAMPEPLTGRKWLCRRIFDRRDPRKPFTGGRPRKRKTR